VRKFWVLLALGVAVVAVTFGMRAWLNSVGADGEVIGIPFGQLVIVLALIFSDRLGLPKLRWSGCVLKGLFMGVGASLLAYLWGVLMAFYGAPLQDQPILLKISSAGPLEFALLGMVAGIFGPFVEEVYFRGWWQGVLAQTLSPGSAIILVAFVFAVLHGVPLLLPGLWIAGCIFGITAYRWGLTAAIVAHAVFNSVTIVAARSGLT
jgi:membrane protease YdiL (CAAX protease family)